MTDYMRPYNFTSQALNPTQRRRSMNFINRLNRRIAARRAGGRARIHTVNRQRRQKSYSGILGGTNADQRMVYRKKRMPKKKRKMWLRFVKKVNAVDERELGSRTVLINDTITSTHSAGQGCLTLSLYSWKNDAPTRGWLRDLEQIGGIENAASPTVTLGATVNPTSKVMFHSGIMDVTIRNTSYFKDTNNAEQAAPDAAIELDLYEIYHRTTAATGSVTPGDMSTLLNSYDDDQIGGTGTGISITDRGASPFEFGGQMGKFGIKILKKTKYFIPNGQTITFQVRDPKRHVCTYKDLTDNDGFAKPGWTRTFYLMYKLVPGILLGSTASTYTGRISVGSTRKYLYKIEGINDNRERLLGGTYTPTNPA